jgi:hypothetical protein
MSVPSNTFETYGAKGIREDLSNVIYNISPVETPLFSNAGRETATNTYFEWQVDTLSAPVSNAYLEGDDAAIDAVQATSRAGNYTQISRKTVSIAGTLEAVDKAGRRSELAYQLAKKSKELKRDMEYIAAGNQVAAAGNAGTARTTAGFETWMNSLGNSDGSNTANSNRGTGGADPVYSGGGAPGAAPTDGTQRAFTEAMLKDVVQQVYKNSVSAPPILMVGPFNKQVVSSFPGIATTRYQLTKPETTAIIGAADIYVSDFGEITVVPNRFQRERSALLVNPEYVSIAYLRNFTQYELAKTGDSEKRELLVEWGVKVHNPAAHGIVADLTTA